MLNITRWQQAAFQNRWCFEHQREERMRHKIIVRKHEWGEFCKTFGNGRVKKRNETQKQQMDHEQNKRLETNFNFKTFVHPGVNESIRLIWQVDWIFFFLSPRLWTTTPLNSYYSASQSQPSYINTLFYWVTSCKLPKPIGKKKKSLQYVKRLSRCVCMCARAHVCMYACVCVCVDEPFSQC